MINFVPLDRNEAAPQPKVSFLDMKHAGQWVAPLAAGLTGLPVDHIMSCYYRCGLATVAPPVDTHAFDDGDPAAAAVSISVLAMRASGHPAGLAMCSARRWLRFAPRRERERKGMVETGTVRSQQRRSVGGGSGGVACGDGGFGAECASMISFLFCDAGERQERVGPPRRTLGSNHYRKK